MTDPTWHFEANDIFGFDGRTVERWTSKKAETPDFIQGTGTKRPVLRKNIKAGNHALEFRSNYQHHMFTEGLGDERFDYKDEFTVFSVCKVNSRQKTNTIHSWGYGNSSEYMWEQVTRSTDFSTIRKNEDGGVSSTDTFDNDNPTSWKILVSRHSNDFIQQFENTREDKKVSGNFVNLYGHWKTYLGTRLKVERDSLDGYVSEIVAFNELLSYQRVKELQSELSKKYGIEV